MTNRNDKHFDGITNVHRAIAILLWIWLTLLACETQAKTTPAEIAVNVLTDSIVMEHFTGSCWITTGPTILQCAEYRGWNDLKMKQDCDFAGGYIDYAHCPQSDQQAHCINSRGYAGLENAPRRVNILYLRTFTHAELELECGSKSGWLDK